MRKIFLSLLFLSAMSGLLSGQAHYLLDHFSAYRDQNRIILTWTVGKGNSCIGIGVYRSTDNIEFKNIHNIFGECGSPEFAKYYSYVDENPVKNQTNYYQLELGFSGRTTSVAVRYDEIPEAGSLLSPNPVSHTAKLLFENREGKSLWIRIYNAQGTLLTQYPSGDESILLDLSGLVEGLYFYTISDRDNKLRSRGRFIKKD